MKIGIISDIHANYEALKSSYKAIEKAGVDKIVCIGDIVGYGAKPRECIDFIREHGIESVRGNHDYYTAREEPPKDIQPYAAEVINWTKNILDPEHVEYLGALPFIIEGDNHVFVHSSLEALDGAYWPYILDPKSALFHFFLQDTRFAFFGHTHIPLFFTCDENHKISIEILKERKISGSRNCQYLINPGSIGQPRDYDRRCSLIIFDTKLLTIELFRVEYDIAKSQENIISAGLPKILAERLSRGS